jgi:hypothetical protein
MPQNKTTRKQGREKPMQSMKIQEVQFTDADVVDIENFMFYSEGSNPHNVHGFILHDQGFVAAVVAAEHLQDALDIAVDGGKLDHLQVSQEALIADYESDEGRVCFLGNASEMFDIEGLGFIEFGIPQFSLVKLLNEEA